MANVGTYLCLLTQFMQQAIYLKYRRNHAAANPERCEGHTSDSTSTLSSDSSMIASTASSFCKSSPVEPIDEDEWAAANSAVGSSSEAQPRLPGGCEAASHSADQVGDAA